MILPRCPLINTTSIPLLILQDYKTTGDLRRPLLCKWAVQLLEPFPFRCVRPSISVAICVPQGSRSAISGLSVLVSRPSSITFPHSGGNSDTPMMEVPALQPLLHSGRISRGALIMKNLTEANTTPPTRSHVEIMAASKAEVLFQDKPTKQNFSLEASVEQLLSPHCFLW